MAASAKASKYRGFLTVSGVNIQEVMDARAGREPDELRTRFLSPPCEVGAQPESQAFAGRVCPPSLHLRRAGQLRVAFPRLWLGVTRACPDGRTGKRTGNVTDRGAGEAGRIGAEPVPPATSCPFMCPPPTPRRPPKPCD